MNRDWMKDESEDLPEQWEQTSRAILQPLRAESSDVFVQAVMRKVREYVGRDEWIRWPVFARWAYPVLALSIAGFTLSLAYVMEPVRVSTDEVVLENRQPLVLADWVSAPAGDDSASSVAVEP
jgi:hypothetical protein